MIKENECIIIDEIKNYYAKDTYDFTNPKCYYFENELYLCGDLLENDLRNQVKYNIIYNFHSKMFAWNVIGDKEFFLDRHCRTMKNRKKIMRFLEKYDFKVKEIRI
jgi:hypothetical protein